ncbi:MAG: methylenetetrahydrofolate reductase [NAD(P)H] [Planctomycetes bacterium]|nr:methylenetetrahydrofolate reductase [NAD(P)H] [Planctomycetota bacterium]
MKVRDRFGRGWPVFSFEFFPPRTDEGARSLLNTVADLQEVWKPDYVSVTYGAGGSTRDRTLDVVTRLQRDLRVDTMAHLTCLGASRAEVAEIVERLVDAGVESVLALRGDQPKDGPPLAPGEMAHATELIALLAERWPVSIGAACYPEGHVESPDPVADLRWTKAKVDAGAQLLVTQLFFDNEHYFGFVRRAREAGIKVPIVPGIMPITNFAQVERFTKLCGATIPPELEARLRRVADDPALVMATGIEHAIRQCRKLLEGGAPGIHFYTLNKSHATRSILAAVRRD